MDLLEHLRGFVAVADELSVSQAADLLHMDQPLLSRRIRALEAHLDVQLLDRARRKIGLTAAGAELVPRARQLLAQADQLVRSVRSGRTDSFALTLPGPPLPEPLAALLIVLREASIDAVVNAAGDDGPVCGWTVEPCDPSSASWTTPLGIAQHPAAAPGGPAFLVDQRPSRDRSFVPLVVCGHDEGRPWSARLHDAADRAGISPNQLQRAAHLEVAVARALTGASRVICSAAEARRHGLSWSPMADVELARGHRLVETPVLPEALMSGAVRAEALALLAGALGTS